MQIWIVNVGDIKPMEFPLSFFMDYAWNPGKIGPTDLQQYTEQWCTDQFGPTHAKEIATIISQYAKFNGRRKPELLDERTYDALLTYEAFQVTKDYKDLLAKAENINAALPPAYRDAYFQLVLHPVRACSNLQEMYFAVARNRYAALEGNPAANQWADEVRRLYVNDSLITKQYHQLSNGKWNHMMSQTHIGYTYWQQPPIQRMPEVRNISTDPNYTLPVLVIPEIKSAESLIPANTVKPSFFEQEGYVSIEADHFSKAVNSKEIRWQVLPDHGRTGSAVTAFPVTATRQVPVGNAPHLQYDIYLLDSGSFKLSAYFSPTLNIHHNKDGLQYAISVDDEKPQVISLNADDSSVQVWQKWVADNISTAY